MCINIWTINVNCVISRSFHSHSNANPGPVTLASDVNETSPTPSASVRLVGIVVPQNLYTILLISRHSNNFLKIIKSHLTLPPDYKYFQTRWKSEHNRTNSSLPPYRQKWIATWVFPEPWGLSWSRHFRYSGNFHHPEDKTNFPSQWSTRYNQLSQQHRRNHWRKILN